MGAKLVTLALCLLLVACSAQEPEDIEENISALNNLGVYYAAEGNSERAKEYFQKVIDRDLSHETARNNLAIIAHKEQDFDTAIVHFTMLVQLNPNNPSYHYDLAISLADNCRLKNKCDLQRAMNEFNAAEELEPGYEMAKENREALEEVLDQMQSAS